MSNEPGFRETQTDLETKKTKYFSSLALKLKEAFKLHKAYDLLAKNEKGVKDWRNASGHQLVVAARTRTLSRLLGLGGKISDDLFLAAGMHDFYKRKTVGKNPERGSHVNETADRGGSRGNSRINKSTSPSKYYKLHVRYRVFA